MLAFFVRIFALWRAVRRRHSCLPGFCLFVPVDQPAYSCHSSLFSMRDGVDAEGALVHVSQLLDGIYDTAQQACEHIHGLPKKGLVDAVLDGIDNEALRRKGLA